MDFYDSFDSYNSTLFFHLGSAIKLAECWAHFVSFAELGRSVSTSIQSIFGYGQLYTYIQALMLIEQ